MKDYYVYIYFDTSKRGKYKYSYWSFSCKPIYVGKGKNGRAYDHVKLIPHCKRPFYEELKRLKKKVKIVIYREGLTEKKAHVLEKRLVEAIGRKITNQGPLLNLAKGGMSGTGPTKKSGKRAIAEANRKRVYKKSTITKMKKQRAGTFNSNTTLTKEEVVKIFKMKGTCKSIGEIFGVGGGTVQSIKSKKAFKNELKNFKIDTKNKFVNMARIGTKNPNAKLTNANIKMIKQNKGNHSQIYWARKFNVTRQCIWYLFKSEK